MVKCLERCTRCDKIGKVYRHKPIRQLVWGRYEDISNRLCAVCVIKIGKANPNYDAACAEELDEVIRKFAQV